MNRNLSLEEIENDYWIKPDSYPSKLIESCYQYRKIPLRELSIEQLRSLIGQKIGLNYLLPIAFEFLEENILAEGDFYEGDLLETILRIKKSFWVLNTIFQIQLKKIIDTNLNLIKDNKLLTSNENFMV